MMCPYANQQKFATKTVCKNIIKKFVSITLLLKESMILLKGKKITKINTYIYIYKISFENKFRWGHCPPWSGGDPSPVTDDLPPTFLA